MYRFFSILAYVAISQVADAAPPTVKQFGGMREVMRKGHTEARVALSDAVATPHAFAVGALEGLAGEITIVDGAVWVSRPDGGELRVTGPDVLATDHATLLTLAHVSEWQAIEIEDSLEGEKLEAFIEERAAAAGIDTSAPFPFVIEGTLSTLDIHVINGYCPIATDPATVDAQPWEWSSDETTEVVIVGFYAPDAAGTMTHHGTSIHAHAVVTVDDETFTGHADHFVAAAGMELRVPRVE